MCKSDERNLMYHVIHCYPRATTYLVVVTTVILLLAIIEAVSS